MPFIKVDPVTEAVELQEMFKNDAEAKKMFRQYEIAHRENSKIKKITQEELELRNRLVEMRKLKNITQKDLQTRTGMTQQAISRFEMGNGVSFKTILKYAEGIDCKLIPQNK